MRETKQCGDVLRFCKVRPVKSPTRAHVGDAGVDFYVPDDFEGCWVQPQCDVLIPSGIKVEVPSGWALVMMSKSGIATKHRLLVGACVVDHGYEGEVHLHVVNAGGLPVHITPGMKLVQGVLLPVGLHQPAEVDAIRVGSARGDGGFGSTGL